MKNLIAIVFLVVLYGCTQQTPKTEDTFEANRDLAGDEYYDAAERITKMQGTWVHTEDSLSIIEVKDSEWVFKYLGTETETPDKYTMTVIDSMRPFTGVGQRGDYLILTNNTDTMHYEIEGIGPEYLTVMYYPREISHTYKRVK